jgi:hypothetical protein
MQALEQELAGWLGDSQHLDCGMDLAINEDLTITRFCYTGRQVDDRPDGGVVEASFKADATEGGIS